MKIVPRDVAFSSFIFQLQKRDLEANLKLRNKNEELAKVEEEIKKLEGHVTILNFDQLRREKEQLEKKKKELEYMVSRLVTFEIFTLKFNALNKDVAILIFSQSRVL